ncbi:MAG: M56 family metallopeptidase [Cyanobacteria bacterium P01_H01_bin.121]
MHLGLLSLVFSCALGIRLWYCCGYVGNDSVAVTAQQNPQSSTPNWSRSWWLTLGCFMVPPLSLLSTLIAILCMGSQGTMWGQSVTWVGCGVAIALLSVASLQLVIYLVQRWRMQRFLQACDQVLVQGQDAYLLQTPDLFAGQIGLWRSHLIVSQGLIEQLNAEQLTAVLAHEQAHQHYNDPLYFFGLDCLRNLTTWLPGTQHLWQQLLLLREQRADRWASRVVDPLLLAETLLQVASSRPTQAIAFSTTLYDINEFDRLEARIDSLLAVNHTTSMQLPTWRYGIFWLLITLPLTSILFHF